ncbi:MAG: hypothetical protein JW895_02225 [Thermoleophilaceae bacterium]|nr:hypothetical protein [Thermoleophilaceae bacterium]
MSAARVQMPPDLDPEDTARWEAYRGELDAAIADDESDRALHAQAMLDRVRYGSH